MEATTATKTTTATSHTKLQLEEDEEEPQATTTTTTTTTATIIDIPMAPASCNNISTSSFLSNSACSSSYDTDCSTASSTCCTRQGEHIYMQRDTLHKLQVTAPMATTAATSTTATAATTIASTSATCNLQTLESDELMMLKFEHRKHWPWFILLISVIEVSNRIHSHL